jgi:hypothetical protein
MDTECPWRVLNRRVLGGPSDSIIALALKDNIHMSLRPSLYSWKLQEFIDLIGSKNSVLLKAAAAQLADIYKNEKAKSKLQSANAWLGTLINQGLPFRRDRERPTVGANGNLLVTHMEAGIHVAVIHSVVCALGAKRVTFDEWGQATHNAIHRELRESGFLRLGKVQLDFLTTNQKLACGTPLFGDDFYTGWEFYSIIENHEIAALVAGFRAALRFKRKLPRGLPKDARKRIKTRVSDEFRDFIGKFVKWFRQIQKAGQDAYILWS